MMGHLDERIGDLSPTDVAMGPELGCPFGVSEDPV
jgi:hypothetical protein